MSLARHLPLLKSLRGYRRADLAGDLGAGLTTAVMLVPQGMAYAMLAGLPPIVGLYASTLPLVLYAVLGTSRQLAVGPVAMVSLLVAGGVGVAAGEGASPAQTVGLAVLLAAMVGVMQTAMGVLRLGFLVNFLSHPVVSGFTSAAALIIGFSQLKHLLGIDLPRSHHVHTIVQSAVERAGELDPAALIIGVVGVAALLVGKRLSPRFPTALLVVVLSTLAVWGLGLRVNVVGEVPAGLPGVALPTVSLSALRSLWPTALAISLVGFMESISVAKAFARKHRTELDANQELIGLGVANLGAAVVAGYPVTGGFSRTAVNDQAGARTGVAALVTAGVVVMTLLFLTPLFFHLPKSTLAAIIMVAVFGLVDVREVRHLWRVNKSDLALLALTFVATLTLGIEAGVGLGVGASLLWFVVRTTRPHYAVLGRVPGTQTYKNLARYPDAVPVPGALILRVDAQLYFGNVTFLKETLASHLNESAEVRAVILDATSVNQLDSSADAALHEIVDDLTSRGLEVFFAGLKGPVLDVMNRSGLNAKLRGRCFLTVHDAVAALAPIDPERDVAAAA